MIEEVVSVVLPSKGWTVVENVPYFLRRVAKEERLAKEAQKEKK